MFFFHILLKERKTFFYGIGSRKHDRNVKYEALEALT